MTATIHRVARPRGEVTPAQSKRMLHAAAKALEAENAYRVAVVQALTEGASFAEVARVTGLSTNTLQRWKREAAE